MVTRANRSSGSIRMYHPGVPHDLPHHRDQLQLLIRHHDRCHGPLRCLVRARRTTSLPRTQAQLGRNTRTSYRKQHAPSDQGRGEQRKGRRSAGRLNAQLPHRRLTT